MVEFIGISIYTIMSSTNNDSFASSFPIWMPFISFSCLITVAKTSNIYWIEVVKEDILVSFLILVGKLYFLSIKYDVGCRFLVYDLYYVEECSLYYHFVERFIINGCCTLSNAFYTFIDTIMWLLSFLLFMWCIVFIDLWILYHTCLSGMNTTWSWCLIFLMYCWMRFANIFLGILASMFISDIGL